MINIIANDFKRYSKTFLIWIIVWAGMALLEFSIFPNIQQAGDLSEVFIEYFPESMREAFALDSETYTTPEGFFSTELLTLYISSVIILFSFQTTSLHKAENLIIPMLRPVKRSVINLANILYIFLSSISLNIIFFLLAIVSQKIFVDDQINWQFYLAAYFGVNLAVMAGLGLTLFVGGLLKASWAQYITIAYPVISLIINGVSGFDGVPDFIKYTSLFYYIDLLAVVKENSFDVNKIITVAAVSLVLISIGSVLMKRKDIDM